MNQVQLWQLSSAQFNHWRISNDIPKLFEFFASALPSFDDWMRSNGMTVMQLHSFVPLGELFAGEKRKQFFRNPEPEEYGDVYQASELEPSELEAWWDLRGKGIAIEGSFVPYFAWLKANSDNEGYFCFDKANSQFANTFVFTLWDGGLPSTSRAYIFRTCPVLKLGGVKLPQSASFNARNLDFCDLDHLEVGPGWLGSRWKPINYSSCREMVFRDTEANFFDFFQCATWELRFENSKLQDFRFRRCVTSATMRFENSTIRRVSFESTMVFPIFVKCQPSEIDYLPDPRERRYAADASAYRAIRSLFQSVGLTSEAGQFFYREQCAHRRALFSPYAANVALYKGLDYPGDGHLREGGAPGRRQSRSAARTIARRRLVFRINAWLNPHYALITLRFKLKWLTSLIDWALWGYSERPARIFSAALLWILLYSGIYACLVDGVKSNGIPVKGFVDNLYFSIVTFTTLGYGDVAPTTALTKLLCGSEALLGAFTMGLVVAGFSNRNRY